MSTVRDKAGNILNEVAEYVARHKYSGIHQNTIDWFDKHPEDKPSMTKVVVEDGKPVAIVPDVEVNEAIKKLALALPSAADLDATAAEQGVVDATASSGDDVPQVQLPAGPVDTGLAQSAESAVSEPAIASDSAASDVSEVPPSGDGL